MVRLPNWRQKGRQARRRSIAPKWRKVQAEIARTSACPSTISAVVQRTQPCPDAAFRRGNWKKRLDPRGRQVYLSTTPASCPTAIDNTSGNWWLATRRAGDQRENQHRSKQLDPTDLIDPRSAISGSTNLEVRATKHLYLRQRDEGPDRRLDRQQDRLADPDHPIAAEMAESTAMVAGTGASPAIWTGASRRKGHQPPGMEGKVFMSH